MATDAAKYATATRPSCDTRVTSSGLGNITDGSTHPLSCLYTIAASIKEFDIQSGANKCRESLRFSNISQKVRI